MCCGCGWMVECWGYGAVVELFLPLFDLYLETRSHVLERVEQCHGNDATGSPGQRVTDSFHWNEEEEASGDRSD